MSCSGCNGTEGPAKGSIVIDARSFKHLPEVLEACRLLGAQTVVLTADELNLAGKYPGVLWSLSHDESSIEFVACGADARIISDKVYLYSGVGGLVVTDDVGVAAEALAGGARAVNFRGFRFDPGSIGNDLCKRDRNRALRSVGKFDQERRLHAPGREDVLRVVGAVRDFLGGGMPNRRAASDGRLPQLLVDADNTPSALVLPVARTIGMRACLFFNRSMRIENSLLDTDPTRPEEADAAFWVELCPAPEVPHGADGLLLNRSMAGDVVLTGDAPLAYACLKRGCTVIDRHGSAYHPEDLSYFPNESVLRQSMRIRASEVKRELDGEERAVRFMDVLYRELVGGSSEA